MKVDPVLPVIQHYTLEVSREELERIFWLSWSHEGGAICKEDNDRIHHFIPDDVKTSAKARF